MDDEKKKNIPMDYNHFKKKKKINGKNTIYNYCNKYDQIYKKKLFNNIR